MNTTENGVINSAVNEVLVIAIDRSEGKIVAEAAADEMIGMIVILSEAELAQTTENIEVAAVAVDETGIRRVVTCLRRSACGLIGVMKDVLDMVVMKDIRCTVGATSHIQCIPGTAVTVGTRK